MDQVNLAWGLLEDMGLTPYVYATFIVMIVGVVMAGIISAVRRE